MIYRARGARVLEHGYQMVLRVWNASQMDHVSFWWKVIDHYDSHSSAEMPSCCLCATLSIRHGLGALTFHTSLCSSHLGESLPLEPRSKSWQNPLTAVSHFEEGEVEHDLIKGENDVNDLKISLGTGSTTWFSLRWCQNLRQSSSVYLRLEIGSGSRSDVMFSSSLMKHLHLNSF